MKRVSPCVWYDGTADEAAQLYTNTFADVRTEYVLPKLHERLGTVGETLAIRMLIGGEDVLLLNGGPMYAFPGNVSLFYRCRDQAEIDRCWQMLGEGGEYWACGWLRDPYGVAWQIIPAEVDEMLASSDRAAILRMMEAMWDMEKLDLAALRTAFAG